MDDEWELGLEEVLKQIKKGNFTCNNSSRKTQITIKKCILELSTIMLKTAGGKVKLKVLPIEVEGEVSLREEMIQKVTLTMILMPSKRKVMRKIPDFGLVRLVKEVRDVMKIIERIPFRLEDFKVEVNFGVSRKGKAFGL